MMGRTKPKVLLAAAVVLAGPVGGGVAWGLAADPPAKGKGAGEPPAGGDKLRVLDLLKISTAGTFAEAPLRDVLVVVEPGGKVALGPEYGGRVRSRG